MNFVRYYVARLMTMNPGTETCHTVDSIPVTITSLVIKFEQEPDDVNFTRAITNLTTL